jgi:hypothetical protein
LALGSADEVERSSDGDQDGSQLIAESINE